MNNVEKKRFIVDMHRLYMEQRPYDGDFPLEIKKKQEDD